MFSSVQLLSCVQPFTTPRITARQASLSINSSQSSLKLMSIESVMPSSHLIPCSCAVVKHSPHPILTPFCVLSTLGHAHWGLSHTHSPDLATLGVLSSLQLSLSKVRNLQRHHATVIHFRKFTLAQF